MTLPSLRVGQKTARYCVVQGGMSIRISMHRLAAAVAEAGGVGTIGGMGISPEDLRREIRAARALTQGVVGVNLMYAGEQFDKLLDVCIEECIDYVAIGAGFARGPFKRLDDAGITAFCIISSVKAARIVSKTRGITGVVVESGQAGGHLGPEDPNISTWDLFPPVRAALREHGFTGPIIAAGGLIDRQDILRALEMGADGVQMGTRFAMTQECNASDEMKARWLAATGSQVIDWSPTGFMGRAIVPHTADDLPLTSEKGVHCVHCLKNCLHRDHGQAHCIWNALVNSQKGNVERGLVFSGGRVGDIHEILTVQEVFERLLTPLPGERNDLVSTVTTR